jgi:hypothetical protein
MSMFSEPPSTGDTPAYQLTETTLEGPLGGPSYGYRSAVIDCMKGGYVCRLLLPAHPLDRHELRRGRHHHATGRPMAR